MSMVNFASQVNSQLVNEVQNKKFTAKQIHY